MSKKIKFSKEEIITKSVLYVQKYGFENLTVRELANYIGCSTQPIFKNYLNFDEYKKDLKQALRNNYDNFIKEYIDETNYLFTISYAYALYAKKEPNIFRALFITELANSRTIKEVLTTPRNVPTIIAMTKQFQISKEEAENIYRDVRFYTHGIATQLSIKSIKLTDNEIFNLIDNNIKINLRKKER